MCRTCNDFGYVRNIHRGHGVMDYTGTLIPVSPIRWYFPDYGVQTCLCPHCQTVAGKKRQQAQERAA